MIQATYRGWSDALQASFERTGTFDSRTQLREFLILLFGKKWEIVSEQEVARVKSSPLKFWEPKYQLVPVDSNV